MYALRLLLFSISIIGFYVVLPFLVRVSWRRVISIIGFCVVLPFLKIGISWRLRIVSRLFKRCNTRRLAHLFIVRSWRWAIAKVKLLLYPLLFFFSIIGFCLILPSVDIGVSCRQSLLWSIYCFFPNFNSIILFELASRLFREGKIPLSLVLMSILFL